MPTAEVMQELREAWIQAIADNPGMLPKDRDDAAYDKMIDDASIPILRQFGEDVRETIARKFSKDPKELWIAKRIRSKKIE